jgi:hypothetical protein
MSKSSLALSAWIALNAGLFVLLMARRPRPRLQHMLFRWVIGDRRPDRPRRLARYLIMAHRHHH